MQASVSEAAIVQLHVECSDTLVTGGLIRHDVRQVPLQSNYKNMA